MSELARRVVTAVILAPLAAGAIYLGGWFFAGFLIVVTIVGQSELYRMAKEKGVHAFQPGGFVAGGLIVLIPMWSGAIPLAALALVMLICAELWRHHTNPIENVAVGILGVIYPSFFVAWYLYIRVEAVGSLGEMNAFLITLAIMVSVWAADIFAYFIGKNFGKTQLIPRISPKKTVEGLVGGISGSIVVMVLSAMTVLPFLGWIHAVTLGLIAGLIGPLGDLIESLFKRSANVKDSGSLLPGHGGVLDRIDALLFVGPVAVIYLQYIAGLF